MPGGNVRVDASALDLSECTWYGSAVGYGGNESFDAIRNESLEVFAGKVVVFGALSGPRETEREIGSSEKAAASNRMMVVLKSLYRKVVKISRAGPRDPVATFCEFQKISSGLMFARSSNGSCVSAALLNSVRELCGDDTAVPLRDRMGNGNMSDIRELSKRVQ